MSDTLPAMAKDKQVARITVRLEDDLFALARTLANDRRADDVSDYIRGLLVVDAVTEGKSLGSIAIPGWLIEQGLIVPGIGPRSSVASPTGERSGQEHEHGKPKRSGKS